MLSVIGINVSTYAQKAINSVHLYDIKNEAMEKIYIAGLKENGGMGE